MDDQQFWRIVIGAAIAASIPYFLPLIQDWINRRRERRRRSGEAP